MAKIVFLFLPLLVIRPRVEARDRGTAQFPYFLQRGGGGGNNP